MNDANSKQLRAALYSCKIAISACRLDPPGGYDGLGAGSNFLFYATSAGIIFETPVDADDALTVLEIQQAILEAALDGEQDPRLAREGGG